jgi:DNA primase
MIDLQDLKARINIVDIAEELGLDPKRSGSSFFARCPSHDDQGRPNMAIHPKKGAICFRCGYKADVIKLVADVRYHGDQGQAIQYLANKAGMTESRPSSRRPAPLPKGASLPKEEPVKTPTVEYSWNSLTVTFPAGAKMVAVKTGEGERKWTRLDDGRVKVEYTPEELVFALAYSEYNLTLEEFAGLSTDEVAWILSGVFDCELTSDNIKTASVARPSLRVSIIEALLSYGQSDGDSPGHIWLRDKKGIDQTTQTAFGLTWLDWERASAGMIEAFGVEALDRLGLMTRDKTKGTPHELRFKKHRLLFPFWITAGRRYPVYLQGRDVNAGKEYRFDNLAGTVPCPYNFDAVLEARKEGKPVFLCEGATDTMTLFQNGYKSVGIVGTQGFKSEWVKHFDGLEVYIATDPDEPGREAAKKIAGVFVKQGRYSPKIIQLPEGQDVTDYFTGSISKHPAEGVKG